MSNYCYCAAGGKTKYPFHEAAFGGDIKKLEELFKIEDLETKDCGGNTPLLIAVKAQQKFLLSKGANPLAEDSQGWSSDYFLPLIKDKECLKLFIQKISEEKTRRQKDKFKQLGKALTGIPNGFLEIDVKVTTWIPFVSRLIPSSKITIKKQANMIRLDFEVFGKSSFSIIFIGNDEISEIYKLDPDTKRYFNLYELIDINTEGQITDEVVTQFVNQPNTGGNLDTKHVTIKPQTKFFGGQKTELVAKMWDSKCYEIDNMKVILFQQQQHENPSADYNISTNNRDSTTTTNSTPMIQDANKSPAKPVTPFDKLHAKLVFKNEDIFVYPIIKGGRIDATIRSSSEVKCITSLIPTNECENENPKTIPIDIQDIKALCEYGVIAPDSGILQLKFQSKASTAVEIDYTISNSPQDLQPETLLSIGTGCMSKVLAYKPIKGVEKMAKVFKANVSMCENFPYTIEQILPILSVLEAGGEEYNQISSFFKTKLPNGFPVKAKIPLFLTFSLEYCFTFAKKQEIDPSEFVVPSDYIYFNPLLDIPIQQELTLESNQTVVVTGMLNCNINPPEIHDVVVFDAEGRQIEMNVEELKKKGLEEAITHKLEEVKITDEKGNVKKIGKNKSEDVKIEKENPKVDEPRVEILEDNVVDEDEDGSKKEESRFEVIEEDIKE